MIHPVKVYDKDGKLTRIITTDELLEIRERVYDVQGKKKITYRKRFDAMANAKKQAPGPVATGEGDAASKAERPRNPVRSGGNRGVDEPERTKIIVVEPSIFKELKENLDKLRNFLK
jgi:FtsZ-interacting cell division protein YlmF